VSVETLCGVRLGKKRMAYDFFPGDLPTSFLPPPDTEASSPRAREVHSALELTVKVQCQANQRPSRQASGMETITTEHF
jgi:hypothetical protein